MTKSEFWPYGSAAHSWACSYMGIRWSEKIALRHFSNPACLSSIHAKFQLRITICRFHHLSNLTIKAILLVSSVKTLYLSLLNFAVFLILIYCFLRILYDFFWHYLCRFFFLDGLFYSHVELLPNSLYNLQI